MRYQYIREHRQEFSVKRMCQVLGVTRSGYYAWQSERQVRAHWRTECWWSKSEWNTKSVARHMAVHASGPVYCARESLVGDTE